MQLKEFRLVMSLAAGLAALQALLWVVAALAFPRTAPVAVLHYSLGTGIDFVGGGEQIMTLPSIGAAVLIGNSLLAWALRGVSRRAGWLLISGIPIVQLILIGAIWLLRQYNF